MRFDIMAAVFKKELREMLRDRRSLAVMIGIPLLLYPLLAIGIAGLTTSKVREQKDRAAKVVVSDAAAAPELRRRLEADESGIDVVDAPDVEKALASGEADAAIAVPAGAEARALRGEPAKIEVRLDRSRTAAAFAENKIDAVLDDYDRWIIEQRLKGQGVPASVLEPLERSTVDIARAEQRFGKIMAQMLPLLLLMTGMLGALFPALNATTTERELGTLETLLVTPAGRSELLFAKGALVLLSALVTAGLNMVSMSLVMKRALSMVDDAEMARNLSVSLPALLLTFLAAVPALVFFTTIVLIVGLLARNFREANSFATPVMLLPLASMAVGIMEPAATPGVMITPIANTTVIIREVLTGRATLGGFALAFVSSLVYAGLMLSVAARLFSNEQLVNPAWEPLSVKGLRRTGAGKRPRRLPAVDEALALFVVSLLLLFYVTPSFVKHGLLTILAVNQLLLVLAPALLFAFLGRWRWVETFSLRRAWPAALVGGAIMGIGLVPWVQLLSGLQHTVWPRAVDESARFQAKLIIDALTNYPVLTIVLVGALAGICEELLFRGPIQAALSRKLPPWGAIVVTALLFGLAHMDLQGLAIRTLLGIILGWIVWRGGSIYPAMLLHGLYDSAALTYATWKIRTLGTAAVTEEAGAFQFNSELAVLLAIGGALIVAGWFLCRHGFRERQKDAGAPGFPVVASA